MIPRIDLRYKYPSSTPPDTPNAGVRSGAPKPIRPSTNSAKAPVDTSIEFLPPPEDTPLRRAQVGEAGPLRTSTEHDIPGSSASQYRGWKATAHASNEIRSHAQA